MVRDRYFFIIPAVSPFFASFSSPCIFIFLEGEDLQGHTLRASELVLFYNVAIIYTVCIITISTSHFTLVYAVSIVDYIFKWSLCALTTGFWTISVERHDMLHWLDMIHSWNLKRNKNVSREDRTFSRKVLRQGWLHNTDGGVDYYTFQALDLHYENLLLPSILHHGMHLIMSVNAYLLHLAPHNGTLKVQGQIAVSCVIGIFCGSPNTDAIDCTEINLHVIVTKFAMHVFAIIMGCIRCVRGYK